MIVGLGGKCSFMVGKQSSRQACGWSRKLSFSYLDLVVGLDYKHSKPPTMTCFLQHTKTSYKHHQQCHYLRTKCSNILEYGAHSHLNDCIFQSSPGETVEYSNLRTTGHSLPHLTDSSASGWERYFCSFILAWQSLSRLCQTCEP